MKNWLNKYFMFFIASLALMSCEKDEDQIIIKEGTSPVLSVSSSNLVLVEDNAEAEAVKFAWQAADFGYKAAVTYTLQVDTANNEFATPYNIVLGNSLEKSYTVEELNALMTKLKYEPEVAHDVNIRVMASVSDRVTPVYSDMETLSVTTYSTFVEPGFIYAPGGYQGWNPGTAPALISVNNDGIYKGILSFVGSESLEFKFTANRNWDLNYGGGAAAGTLAQNGSNLTVPTADSYEVTVNLNSLTWSAKKFSWGIIGNATPGGWENDTNMKYINEEGVWKATIVLTTGEMKFRLNDAWDVNYGDTGNDKKLELGGDNIAVTAGTYEVVLDLENADGTATYTITKK